jgi:enoyl-CoA hydratase/carnithine racemase
VLDLAVLLSPDTDGQLLGPRLRPDGVPGRPVVTVDLSQSAGLSQQQIGIVAANLQRARAAVIGVSVSALPPPAQLLEAAAVTLVAREAAFPAERRTVACADVGEAVARLESSAQAAPTAALALCWLLRSQPRLAVEEALVAESALYSALLAGGEFRTWLARRAAARAPEPGRRVDLARRADIVHITLTRAARRNALDARMRDELGAALAVAEWDEDLRVEIRGEGPDFCAGGDLDEFGRAGDLAAAHMVRVEASVGVRLHRLADRVRVDVHGRCIGAGVELPAFAGQVVAAPGSTFRLPEVNMGLVPGAGGTVSVTARIGRWRTFWLAVTGAAIDAGTARAWGLIDSIS